MAGAPFHHFGPPPRQTCWQACLHRALHTRVPTQRCATAFESPQKLDFSATFGFEAKPMASECLEAVAVQFKHDRVEAPPPTPLLAPLRASVLAGRVHQAAGKGENAKP